MTDRNEGIKDAKKLAEEDEVTSDTINDSLQETESGGPEIDAPEKSNEEHAPEKSKHQKKTQNETAEPDDQKEPLALRIFGVLSLVGGIVLVPLIIGLIVMTLEMFSDNAFRNNPIVTQIIFIVLSVSIVVTVIGFIILGIRLVRNKRRGARYTAEFLIVMLVIDSLGSLMIYGVDLEMLSYVAVCIILIVMLTYIDPSLSRERQLHRELRNLKTQEKVERGTLGRDESGKGYISLNFFNLFWIFVIACIIGDLFETVYHMIVTEPGVYQDRAGLLFGPFSPIYGIGAIFMTLALNRFHKRNFLIIFVVSALIGGVFEYLVSWFLQSAFGITAWDYTGTPGSILGGRTSLIMMIMWGVLGVVWIKLLLPLMLRIVNLIPWKWRYTVTTVCAVLMAADCFMTLVAVDCWYSRNAGGETDTAIMQFCDTYFNDDWMQHRFQSMLINPSNSTRA